MSWKRANVLDRMAVLLEKLDPHSGYWIDIGTGEGVFTQVLIKNFHPITPVQMDKSKFTSRTPLGFIGRLEHLPVRAGSISGMICAQVVHYIPGSQQSEVLDHLGRTLSSGGQLVLIAYKKGQSYPWVPHHISESDVREYMRRSSILDLQTILYDNDRRRPKFAAYLVKR